MWWVHIGLCRRAGWNLCYRWGIVTDQLQTLHAADACHLRNYSSCLGVNNLSFSPSSDQHAHDWDEFHCYKRYLFTVIQALPIIILALMIPVRHNGLRDHTKNFKWCLLSLLRDSDTRTCVLVVPQHPARGLKGFWICTKCSWRCPSQGPIAANVRVLPESLNIHRTSYWACLYEREISSKLVILKMVIHWKLRSCSTIDIWIC